MAVWRNEVSLFDEREMAIVTAFAGQAAMAINGVKLVQELEARRAELARKVDELEALREVGEAVGSSSTSTTCWSTIAMHAVELSETGWRLDPGVRRARPLLHGSSRVPDGTEVIDRLRSIRIELDETLVGRAAKERRPLAVTDLNAVDLDAHLRIPRVGLASRARGPDAAGGADRWCASSCAENGLEASPRGSWS